MQNDSNSFDRLVDPLIDDVAREMTDARPVDEDRIEGFVRQVSTRINEKDVARAPRTWRLAWALVPAAACAIVLLVFLFRETQSPSSIRPKQDALAQATTADVRLKPDATPAADVRPQPDVTTATATVATDGARPRAVSALAPPPALSTDPDLWPLTTSPIEMASLDVSPLVTAMPIEISKIAIERIEIAAMR